MPILEVVHSLINYAQCRDVFIMEFLNAINLAEVEFFTSILIQFLILVIHCLMISPTIVVIQ